MFTEADEIAYSIHEKEFRNHYETMAEIRQMIRKYGEFSSTMLDNIAESYKICQGIFDESIAI